MLSHVKSTAWPNRRPNGAGRQHRPRKLADEAGGVVKATAPRDLTITRARARVVTRRRPRLSPPCRCPSHERRGRVRRRRVGDIALPYAEAGTNLMWSRGRRFDVHVTTLAARRCLHARLPTPAPAVSGVPSASGRDRAVPNGHSRTTGGPIEGGDEVHSSSSSSSPIAFI